MLQRISRGAFSEPPASGSVSQVALRVSRSRTASSDLALHVADLDAAGQVADVPGFGDVVRHVGHLGQFGTLGDQCPDVAARGVELQVRGGLACAQFELGQGVLVATGLVPLAPAPRVAHVGQQLRFLAGQRLLALGLLRIGGLLAGLGDLVDAAPCQRQQEEPAVAHEGDVRLVARPAGRRLPSGRAGQVGAGAGHGVDQGDVAAGGAQHPAPRAVPLADDRRRQPALVVGQAAQARPVGVDQPGGGFFLVAAPATRSRDARRHLTSGARRADTRPGRARA